MKKIVYRLQIVSILIGICHHVNAQKIINLSDYGIIPNSYQNASPAIAQAIKDASGFDSCIIKFPGGRIDLWPDGATKHVYYISNATENDSCPKVKTIGMLFKDLSNVTLEGNNTLLVYHSKMMLMAIDHCKNFKVKDLRFDFQRPTMSEMKIVSKTDTDVVVYINPDSWYDINDHQKLIWYGEGWKTHNPFVIKYVPEQGTMYYASWRPFAESDATELSPFEVKFTGNFKGTNLKEGDILTIRDPYRDEVGVFNDRSENVTFDNLKFYYIHGLGIVSQLSKNIFLKKVNVAPKPSSGRVISAFADCFHFSNCYGSITIDSCFTSGAHDDPVNVHGTYLRIMKADSNRLIVRFMHPQTWGYNPYDKGDSIEFIHHQTLLSFGTAVVKSAKMISKREIEVVLDKPAPKEIQENDVIGDITKTPSVIIKNSRFEHTETRGVLVTTRRKVLIENNVFYKTGMHAILVADDCNSWFESGPVRDVTIQGNKFIDCGYNSYPDDYVIMIKPETTNFLMEKYVHSNIRIINNQFQTFDSPLLFASDTKGLTFTGNMIEQKAQQGFPTGNRPAFNFEHCNQVVIQNNNFEAVLPQEEIKISFMKKRMMKYAPSKEFHLISE